MKCPQCQIEFQTTERQGIEIDYCPNCRAPAAGDRGREYEHRPRKKESFWNELFDFG